MREVYALIPCYAADELWKDATLLSLLSAVIGDVSQALQNKGIALVVIEPNAATLQRVSTGDGIALMQTYCLLSDCVVRFEGLQDRYQSPLIDFMHLNAQQLGLPILAADCVPSGLGTVNSLAEALAILPPRNDCERRIALRSVLGKAPSTLPKLIDIDPNLEDLSRRFRGNLESSAPLSADMNLGDSSQVRFAKLPGSFALEATSISCGQANTEQMLAVKRQLDRHKLLVFRNQNLSPEDQIKFTAFFGAPDMAWDNRNRAQEEPRIQIISNQYKGGEYHYDRSRRMSTVRYWHADTSFLANPTRYTFLYIQKVPEKHGLSHFASTRLGYESLPSSLKIAVDDKFVCHSFDYIFGELLKIRNEQRADPVPDVVHPLVWRSDTGDTLYLSELSQSHIIGLSQGESDKLLTQVTEHCKQAQFCHTHVWRPGDFLVWDNIGVMHRGGFSDPEYERVLHRTTVTVRDAAATLHCNEPECPVTARRA